MKKLDFNAIYKALANPARREILLRLKNPESISQNQAIPKLLGISASAIEEKTNLSQSTVSSHLSTLLHAGLVTVQRVGQWRFFKRNETTIQAFLQYLNNNL